MFNRDNVGLCSFPNKSDLLYIPNYHSKINYLINVVLIISCSRGSMWTFTLLLWLGDLAAVREEPIVERNPTAFTDYINQVPFGLQERTLLSYKKP